jgi:hypothetical protein
MNIVKVRCPQFLIENKALALMLAQPSMIKRPVARSRRQPEIYAKEVRSPGKPRA